MDETRQPDDVSTSFSSAIRAGDAQAFGDLVQRYRGELRVHCYRMLGSYTEAEDHVQESLLRAWRARDSYRGRAPVRAWLYRIATNVCLDTLRSNTSRRIPTGSTGLRGPNPSEIAWLEPYPDDQLDTVASELEQPDAVLVAKVTVELAYLATIQLLPPNQRAVLILRDVLDWSASETAELLDTSVASANSALQRARATLRRELPEHPDDWQPDQPNDVEQDLLARYVDAHARADAGAVLALLSTDIRFTMPPQPVLYQGIDDLSDFFCSTFADPTLGDFRLVPTRANRQPAAANYLRRPGDNRFRALALDVLRIERGRIAEITTFEPRLFPAFGLPEVLPDQR